MFTLDKIVMAIIKQVTRCIRFGKDLIIVYLLYSIFIGPGRFSRPEIFGYADVT